VILVDPGGVIKQELDAFEEFHLVDVLDCNIWDQLSNAPHEVQEFMIVDLDFDELCQRFDNSLDALCEQVGFQGSICTKYVFLVNNQLLEHFYDLLSFGKRLIL
jgi:hypothetical protein